MSLMISFVLELKGERIDGDGLWLCFSFIIITKVSYAGKWSRTGREIDGFGSGRMIEMITLDPTYTYVLSS